MTSVHKLDSMAIYIVPANTSSISHALVFSQVERALNILDVRM